MHTMPLLSLALCSGHANVVIGLVQRSGNQCHDRPWAMIGQVPVQLETYISPVVGKVRLAEQHMFTKTKVRSVYIYKCIYVYIPPSLYLLYSVTSIILHIK